MTSEASSDSDEKPPKRPRRNALNTLAEEIWG
jgi:hypothetical protein